MPTAYRYDIANTGRAGCQNSKCKNEGIKIQKGELRFATLVTFQEHDTWRYKHWGCVTPVQVANIITQLGGLEDLDLNKDLDILDGYDELPGWAQAKVRYALQHGHVEDEDWKGDPELNRPGQKGINKRTPKKKKKGDDEDDDEKEEAASPDPSPTKSKTDKGRGKKQSRTDGEGADPGSKKKATSKKRKSTADVEDDELEQPQKPKARSRSKKAKVEPETNESAIDEPLPKARRKTSTPKSNAVTDKVAAQEDAEAGSISKIEKKKRVKVEKDKDEPAPSVARQKSKVSKTKKRSAQQVKDEEEAEDELRVKSLTSAEGEVDGVAPGTKAKPRKRASKKTKA